MEPAEPHAPGYCCLGEGDWHRVLARSGAGVMIDSRRLDSATLWHAAAEEPPADAETRFVRWDDLDVPLPHRGTRCWGYALSYPEHQRETLKHPVFRFLKEGTVEPVSAPIPWREHLDFELEIGLLMHRETPDRFGYFLANDLTDRGIQVERFDRRNPAPGFTLAKSFPGSLRVGPLLVIGDPSVWSLLSATLTLNDEERQTLRAADCRLDPSRLHRELFAEHSGDPWLLAVTGTPAGTLFRAPGFREKLAVLLAGWFSAGRARRAWLAGLKFLAPGDELVMDSPVLGRGRARVIPNHPSQ